MTAFLRALAVIGFCALGWMGYGEVRRVVRGHEDDLADAQEQIDTLNGDLADAQGQAEHWQGAAAELELTVGALEEDVTRLEDDVREAQQRIAELDLAMAYLKLDRRIGRLTVLEQTLDPNGQVESSHVRFEEVDADGDVLGEPVEAWIPGRFAYVESLVIKFDDAFVEAGDHWRGTSLCLFRRLFSEAQSPEEGISLDTVGRPPEPYADDSDPDLVERLWARFWDYANDPQAAADAGVRAIHGEAPFIELRDRNVYEVSLRASGGLSLRTVRAGRR
jgi:hypothetical protein